MQNKTSYLIVRLAIGVSMFGHGLVRLPKLQAFSDGMLKSFENSMLPELLTLPFSYVLPVLEFTFGLCLILGLFTRVSAIIISAVLISLIFGSTLIENWGAITAQLVHIAFSIYLIHNINDNSFAVDKLIKKDSDL
ncbi:DoxX family protein [Formosa agariphila KMM 3901]|uniref:DoxX family protein n=1 Tax=Formosa agariphila (strain DSM 15362 / KCTC 12365 / LMG 23005 / KMM 3901 / M-2Alg 35-1) TaxID=1347342 RepID=T2KQA5_FORAG|nr:DoxX family protein [Formosa agariphila]CDF80169.1 DoxX family protein [Formosa agariphila KMM 3901]